MILVYNLFIQLQDLCDSWVYAWKLGCPRCSEGGTCGNSLGGGIAKCPRCLSSDCIRKDCQVLYHCVSLRPFALSRALGDSVHKVPSSDQTKLAWQIMKRISLLL